MQNNSNIPPLHQEEVRIRGKNTLLPAVNLHGRTVIRANGWLKIAALKDEELVEGEPVVDPERFLADLRASGLGADLLTFVQPPHSTRPKLDYFSEPDNLAVIRTDSYNDWWENRISQESRKNVRRASKREVVVREVPFDETLVLGIKSIYDETPVRQGRAFWHYGKHLAAVRMENATYLERSWFVAAYYKDELIGFIKVIMVDRMATLIQILAKNAHQDKRPMNALLAHTVELCEKKGATHLVYGRYRYGKKQGDSLAEFKRRNGFEELTFPRYHVPLTFKGRIALKLGLHQGWANIIPRPVADLLLKVRAKVMQVRSAPKSAATAAETSEAH